MSDHVFLTTANIDATEGRGTTGPYRLSRSLAEAAGHAPTDGVYGGSSDVEIYRVPMHFPSLWPIQRAPESAKVWGYRTDHLGLSAPGLLDQPGEPLTEDEVRRLRTLRERLGDLAPQLPRPAIDETPGTDATAVFVIWAENPASIALRRLTSPQIHAVMTLLDDIQPTMRAIRTLDDERPAGSSLPRLFASVNSFDKNGGRFQLDEETAFRAEQPRQATPAADHNAALLSEYEALVRKATGS